MHHKRKGYRVERKIRKIFEEFGWKVIRAGASLGEADLVCFKDGICIMMQIKSTIKKTFYYYEYMKDNLEGFPFYVIVDFGYGKIRACKPMKKIIMSDGQDINSFIASFS